MYKLLYTKQAKKDAKKLSESNLKKKATGNIKNNRRRSLSGLSPL